MLAKIAQSKRSTGKIGPDEAAVTVPLVQPDDPVSQGAREPVSREGVIHHDDAARPVS
jgi:hypothetical protein